MSKTAPPPLPFRTRIGVIGAPPISDPQTARDTIQNKVAPAILDLFKVDREKLQDSEETPLTYSILSSLSTKSNRDWVRLLLDELNKDVIKHVTEGNFRDHFQTQLNAIIPQSKEAYEQAFPNFADEEKALHGQSHHPTYIPEQDPDRYIINHCDVVLVFEVDDNKKTQETAERKRRAMIFLPSGETKSEHGLSAHAIDRLDEFNDLSIDPEVYTDYLKNLEEEVFEPGAKDEKIDPLSDNRANITAYLMPYYVKASVQAKKNQSWYHRAGQTVWYLFPFTTVAVATAVLFPAFSLPAFFAKLAILTAIISVVFAANRMRSHEQWVENRFLTERIRAAIYLSACGYAPKHSPIAPYLGNPDHHRGEWMMRAFNEIWNRMPPLTEPNDLIARKNFAKKQWIEGQIRFHSNKQHKSDHMNHWLEYAGLSLFCVAFLVVTTHIVMHYFVHSDAHWVHTLETTLSFLAIFLPSLGAALGGIRIFREYSRLAKRSANMIPALEEIAALLDEADTPERVGTILEEAEAIMLNETQDWLMLMRSKIIEPPG